MNEAEFGPNYEKTVKEIETEVYAKPNNRSKFGT